VERWQYGVGSLTLLALYALTATPFGARLRAAFLSTTSRQPSLHLSGPRRHYVTHVRDGDTFEVGKRAIRIIGLDTPETKHPFKPVEPGGPEASAFAKSKLYHKHVTLEQERVGDRDVHGRELAHVFVDGESYALSAILQGYGRAFTPAGQPNRYRAKYEAAEATARERRLGIWRRGAA